MWVTGISQYTQFCFVLCVPIYLSFFFFFSFKSSKELVQVKGISLSKFIFPSNTFPTVSLTLEKRQKALWEKVLDGGKWSLNCDEWLQNRTTVCWRVDPFPVKLDIISLDQCDITETISQSKQSSVIV